MPKALVWLLLILFCLCFWGLVGLAVVEIVNR